MNNDRPKISIPWEPQDLVLELVNVTLLILCWSLVFINYDQLPETIATHFNAMGEADDFGSKSILWILPGIALFVYILMFIINRFPHTHNYMVNITEKNAFKNYQFSTRIIRWVNLFCQAIFLAITFDVINLAKGEETIFLNPGFIVATVLIPVIILVIAFRMQKKINTEDG